MRKIDADKEILNFIIENKNTTEEITKTLPVSDDAIRRFYLINNGEYIETYTCEFPDGKGGWFYDDANVFDYEYCIVDNKLLSMEFVCDADYGYSRGIALRLFPNAEEYTIKSVKGHRAMPYVQLVNTKGDLANKYPFELPREDLSDFNGLGITDIISSVTSDELIERYNKRYNKTQSR